MKPLFCAFSVLWLTMIAPAAHSAQPPKPLPAAAPLSSPGPEVAPYSSLDGELFYELLLGEIKAGEGDLSNGFALILDAARKTNDAQLYQRAADIALQSRSGESALQATQAWRRAQPESREANRYLLQILVALNRIGETGLPLKTEVLLAPPAERSLAITELPRYFVRASDKKLAAEVLEQALADQLTSPVYGPAAWTAVGRLRLAAELPLGALDAGERAQEIDPRAEGPVLLALQLMDPKLPRAENLLRKYLSSQAAVPSEIRMAYARALLNGQRYAEADIQLQWVTRENPDYPEAWLVLGTLQLQDNRLAQAQDSLLRYIDLAGKGEEQAQTMRALSQAYLLMAQLAEKRQDFAAAQTWLSKISSPQLLILAQSQQASLLAKQGKMKQARQLIRQIPESSPGDARLKLRAEIDLLRDHQEYKNAYELIGQAVTQFPDEPEFLYDQAMMAEKLNQLDDMERLLRQLVKIKPDFHHAYNALGYSLADRNLRLPEAKQLILKALEYAPADPFIKDSLGWVEFRLGNRNEALKIFEAAYKAKPDAEIAAHFGEVMWSLGQRDQAIAIWKEGLLLSPDNKTLLETLKRLRVAP
jgi:tetratricopeptide (TPR) repeat protein